LKIYFSVHTQICLNLPKDDNPQFFLLLPLMDDRHFGYKQKSLNKTPINCIGKRQGSRDHLSRANHMENMFLLYKGTCSSNNRKIHLQMYVLNFKNVNKVETDTSGFVSLFKPVLVSYYLSRLFFLFLIFSSLLQTRTIIWGSG